MKPDRNGWFAGWNLGHKEIEYAVKQHDGTLTVNNGQQKWQVRPEQEVALLPVLHDPVRQGFDLRDEAERALSYPHQVVGSELVAGRQASKMQISPGGLEYYLWIDKETNLPLQLQTAMQNALQTTYTFASFETMRRLIRLYLITECRRALKWWMPIPDSLLIPWRKQWR